MRISAVILSYNSARYLEPCIRSLAAALDAIPTPKTKAKGKASTAPRDEIFVIENGSKDDSPAILRRLSEAYPGLLRVEYLDHNTGTTFSRNLALRQATGDYIAILDSDVEVPVGTLDALIARVDADHHVGIAAPRLMYPSGRLQMSTDVFPTLPRKLQRWFALRSIEQRAAASSPPTDAHEVDYAISAFWLMRRDVVQKVGLFDEKIFYSPEDVDFCLRVWEAGFSVVYDPAVHAVHDAQEISRGLPIKKVTFSHVKGLGYLFWKHQYVLGHDRLYRRIGR